MKKMIKKICACCGVLALFTLMCLPTVASAQATNRYDRNLLPEGIEYPMRRAVQEGRDAVDDLMPDRERGTVNDRTQGASDGVLDGNQSMTADREESSQSDAASESGTADTTGQEEQKGSGMTTAAILIACLAAIAIVVLIIVAIPKSKSKPGGTGNKH